MALFFSWCTSVHYSSPFPLAFFRPFLYDWDINFIYCKSSSLKVCNSVDFSILTWLLYNHHHCLNPEHFHLPQEPHPIYSHSPFLPLLNSSLFLDFQRLLKYLKVYSSISNAYSKYFHMSVSVLLGCGENF